MKNSINWVREELTQQVDIELSINIIQKYAYKIKDLDFENTDEKTLIDEFETFLNQKKCSKQ